MLMYHYELAHIKYCASTEKVTSFCVKLGEIMQMSQARLACAMTFSSNYLNGNVVCLPSTMTDAWVWPFATPLKTTTF